MNDISTHYPMHLQVLRKRAVDCLHTARVLALFIVRNLWHARKLPPFPKASFGRFEIEPLSARTYMETMRLYGTLCGRPLDREKRILLKVIGPRLAMVLRETKRGRLVGLSLYYFNARDSREGTIHLGYAGLVEEMRGQGLGTMARRHELVHLAAYGLKGVSGRISMGNSVSIKMHGKLGFVPIQTYFDNTAQEMRHYVVCDLRPFLAPADKTQGMEKR